MQKRALKFLILAAALGMSCLCLAAPGDLPRIVEAVAKRLHGDPTLELKLLVALGNSGGQYQHTRHNAGFLVSDQLITAWAAYGSTDRDAHFSSVEEAALQYDDGEVIHEPINYRTEKTVFRTELGELFMYEGIPNRIVLIARPFYDINESGRFVGELVRYFNQPPLHLPSASIAVISDNVDLPPGQLKMKAGGSVGGHNGIRSIDESVAATLGDTNYYRVKVGIGRPAKDQGWIGDYVLERFTPEQFEQLTAVGEQVGLAMRPFIEGDRAKAVAIANTKPAACNSKLHSLNLPSPPK